MVARTKTCIFEEYERQAEGYGKFLIDSCASKEKFILGCLSMGLRH